MKTTKTKLISYTVDDDKNINSCSMRLGVSDQEAFNRKWAKACERIAKGGLDPFVEFMRLIDEGKLDGSEIMAMAFVGFKTPFEEAMKQAKALRQIDHMLGGLLSNMMKGGDEDAED